MVDMDRLLSTSVCVIACLFPGDFLTFSVNLSCVECEQGCPKQRLGSWIQWANSSRGIQHMAQLTIATVGGQILSF